MHVVMAAVFRNAAGRAAAAAEDRVNVGLLGS
jgi:hypothetical protein